MKVLVADKFEASGLRGLKAAGCEVAYLPELEGETLTAQLRSLQPEVLIVRSTKVTAAALDTGSLALVVRAGAGTNTIEVAHASARGIYVANCPGRNAIAVAELAFGLLLSLDRRIPDNVQALREGRWNKKQFSLARGLYGQTLGLLGLGAIGVEMIRRAQAFGLSVVAWSRRFAGESRVMHDEEVRALGLEPVLLRGPIRLAPSPEAVAAECQILSVHLPLTSETRGRVGASIFEALPVGATFLNTARGELVDYAALKHAIQTRKLRVGLDVFEKEPAGGTGSFEDPLGQLPDVYGTHHIGASTDQAQEAIAAETVRIVACYKECGKVPNVVNLCTRTPASCMLVVRHLDRPGVLAHVFNHLKSHQINVQETENIIFAGAQAAIARINLDASPSAGLMDLIQQGCPEILELKLIPLSFSHQS